MEGLVSAKALRQERTGRVEMQQGGCWDWSQETEEGEQGQAEPARSAGERIHSLGGGTVGMKDVVMLMLDQRQKWGLSWTSSDVSLFLFVPPPPP